jgi:peptidoglycan/xylan/chitin deacetylase (PgdA/CDA1 family)
MAIDSFPQRLPDMLRHQSARALRLVSKMRRKTQFALSPPSLILCYHRIFEPETDPYLLSVSPDHFRQQLQLIKRIAQPLSLDQLGEAIGQEDYPRRGVVITFDDGYLDNLENALPILRDANLPATIYIATGYIGTDREFWWDDLERLTLGPANLPKILRLRINGRIREWDVESDFVNDREWNVLASDRRNSRQRLFCDLRAALRPLAQPLQDDLLHQLRRLSGTPPKARPSYRCMTVSELEALAAEPLITLGAHTISHCDLDYRTRAEQQVEIAGSKEQLEKIIGRPVEHFSYPYGSFNDESVAVCAQNNFRSAVTCIDKPVHRKSHHHRLPRLLVRNWNGADFARHLKRLFRG